MKKRGIFLLTSALIFGTLSVTSCNSFFGSEAYSIQEVTTNTNDDGSIKVTIKYTDGANMPDYSFNIPKGYDGNGIADIKSELIPDKQLIRIIVKFTDKNFKDYIIEVPVLNGPGIKEITESVISETGEKVMIISFTDDRPDVSIKLPKGDKGVGIKKIENNMNEDGSMHIDVILDDGTTIPLDMPKPNDGIGIENIEISVDNLTGKNIINFVMTDGSNKKVEIDRATVWYDGALSPDSSNNEVAKNAQVGDFYFESVHYIIYKKVSNISGKEWKIIANLGSASVSQKYVVKFNLNDQDGEKAEIINNAPISREIPVGRTFLSEGFDLPLAYRKGYDFLGWYTKSEYNPTLGRFTDLTPVYSEMNLFACWSFK